MRVRTGHHPQTGIDLAHWNTFQQVAAAQGLFVVVRSGTAAALRWIQQGFPPRPQNLSLPLDPATGLVVARSRAERSAALRARHLVVEREPSQFIVVDTADRARPLFVVAPVVYQTSPAHYLRWAAEGVVLDRTRGLPFTAAYTLLGAFLAPEGRSQPASQGTLTEATVSGPSLHQLLDCLNQAMPCSPEDRPPSTGRVQYSNPHVNPPAANATREDALVFTPSGSVVRVSDARWDTLRSELLELLDAAQRSRDPGAGAAPRPVPRAPAGTAPRQPYASTYVPSRVARMRQQSAAAKGPALP